MWYVGLDWADTHHDVVILDEAGRRVGSQRFAHSPEGLNELKQLVLRIAGSPEQLACLVETNHGLLIAFLLEAGFPVYPVNPKTANQLRKAAGAKTDQIDASLLAKTGRFDLAELRRLEPDSAIVAELKTLTRDQDTLIQTQTRLVNQLTACRKRVLSRCLAPVCQVAAALCPRVFANLSHPASRSGRFARRDHRHLAHGQAYEAEAGGPQDF
jgi:transposase